MIPRILHYVWVGGSLPAKQRDYISSWEETNPSFTIQCWNESNIDMTQPIIRDAYKNKKWAKVADVARLQAVLSMGGIYLDTDFKVFKPLDCLLRHKCFYAFQEADESDDWVCNGIFGAEPNHWFVRQALEGLYAMKPNRWLPERPTDFGPKHITRLLRQAGLRSYSPDGMMIKDIYLAPTPVFFPFHHSQTFHPDCITENTLAAHFWEQSWEKTIPMPLRFIRSARNNLRRYKLFA